MTAHTIASKFRRALRNGTGATFSQEQLQELARHGVLHLLARIESEELCPATPFPSKGSIMSDPRIDALEAENARLTLAPCDFDVAADFVRQHHRHHTPPQGHKFSLAAMANDELVGVVIVGRPVARRRDDGRTLEVTRLCTVGHKNACSFLYGAAARATFALGYQRIGTYILKREPGTSLVAAGWQLVAETPGKSWSVPSRPRSDKHPLEPKLLFERSAA